ncbi:MAG: hypothetical protein AB1405_17310 [Bdellovibrionota bacterium]
MGTQGRWPLDLRLRLLFAGGFLPLALLLGVRGWPITLVASYVTLVGAALFLHPRLTEKGLLVLRRVLIVSDAVAISLLTYLTGVVASVAVAFYPLLIFGVTVDWGLSEGVWARRVSNYLYLILVAAVFAGFLPYDPIAPELVSYPAQLSAHHPIWRGLPPWMVFASAALVVTGVNFFTHRFAAHLVAQRQEAEKLLAQAAGRRAAAEALGSVATSLGNPLEESRSLLASARSVLDGLLGGERLENVKADLELAARALERCRALAGDLEGLLPSQEAPWKEVHLADLIHEVRRELSRQYGSLAWAVREDVEPDLPPVRGDVSLLRHAIRSLIEEILLGTPSSVAGEVRLSAFGEEGRIVLECDRRGSLGSASAGPRIGLLREIARFHRGDVAFVPRMEDGQAILRLSLPAAA